MTTLKPPLKFKDLAIGSIFRFRYGGAKYWKKISHDMIRGVGESRTKTYYAQEAIVILRKS
jgi:hypothetical protein